MFYGNVSTKAREESPETNAGKNKKRNRFHSENCHGTITKSALLNDSQLHLERDLKFLLTK